MVDKENTSANQSGTRPPITNSFVVEDQVSAIVNDLKQLDTSYFGKDRVKQIKAKIEEAVAALDTKPIDLSKFRGIFDLISPEQKGKSPTFVPERQSS